MRTLIPAMDIFRESTGVKKVMIVIVPVLLIFNILTGITVISIVQNKSNSYPTSGPDNHQVFKLALEKVYNEESTKEKKKIKVRSAPSLEFLSLLKPVIHLSGLDLEGSVGGTLQRSTAIRNWAVSEGSEKHLMYNGMMYGHGSITVPATGLYFIYSHAKFYVEDNKKMDRQRMFNHSISRYNVWTKSMVPFLINKVTECKEGINDGAHLEYPSDIRGIAHLNAGDQIVTSVSDFELLRHDRDWHYIGAYLL